MKGGGWTRDIMMWKLRGGWKRWHYDVQIEKGGWIRMEAKYEVWIRTGIMMWKSKGGWKVGIIM